MPSITELFIYINMDEIPFFAFAEYEFLSQVNSIDLKNKIIEYINSDPTDEDNQIYLNTVNKYFDEVKDEFHIVK